MLSTCSFWGHLETANAQYPFYFKYLVTVLTQTQENEWQIVQNFYKTYSVFQALKIKEINLSGNESGKERNA